MSMYSSGKVINKALKELLTDLKYEEKVLLLDTIINFGQVAKFRCRSNVAYDNFVNICFEGIANTAREKLEGHDFEILRVKEVL